jgi:hypothetical protein
MTGHSPDSRFSAIRRELTLAHDAAVTALIGLSAYLCLLVFLGGSVERLAAGVALGVTLGFYGLSRIAYWRATGRSARNS